MANRYGTDLNTGMSQNFSSPTAGEASPQKQRKATDEQTLIPVTIRMVLNSAVNILEDGREPHNVKLIGAVRSVEKSSTAYNYEIEDGTGLLSVKEWVDNADTMEVQQLRDEAATEHQYIRIIGKMQEYEGRKQLVAYSVRKCRDMNEMTYHFLEVVHSAEKYQKSNQIVGAPNMSGGMVNNFNMPQTPSASNPMAMNIDSMNNTGDALGDDIMRYLRAFHGGEDGASAAVFVQQNAGKYTAAQVKKKLEALSTEGMIYSTIDDDHYCPVEEEG